MTTFTIGRRAEAAAAEYLKAEGFEIIQQNYRTRYCEIDIIARKDRYIYFVEVKYRFDDDQGSGLDYITGEKLKQMALATRYWLQDKPAPRGCFLSAIEVSGGEYEITAFIESIT